MAEDVKKAPKPVDVNSAKYKLGLSMLLRNYQFLNLMSSILDAERI